MAQFTLKARKMLAQMLDMEETYREMGESLGLPHTTVWEEVCRNGGREAYDPYVAEERAGAAKLKQDRQRKVDMIPGLKSIIEKGLKKQHSPMQIAGSLSKEARGRTIVSHETIYQYIYSKEGKRKKLWLELRHKKIPKRQKRGKRKQQQRIPERISIHHRPEMINNRTEFGHWEADLMVFSTAKKVLTVFVERTTRRTVAFVTPDKTAASMEKNLHALIALVGLMNMKSLTFDNGLENVCHARVRHFYGDVFDTYFCDPYCSWQKGLVENTNKLLRQYFPRYLQEHEICQEHLNMVLLKLNLRPREILQFQNPQLLFDLCSV